MDANQEPHRFRSVAATVGRTTVPQIFLDGRYIGGWTELAGAAKTGRLDAYLGGQDWRETCDPDRAKAKKRWFRRG